MSEEKKALTEEQCNKIIEEIMHIERQYANEKKHSKTNRFSKVLNKIDEILTDLHKKNAN